MFPQANSLREFCYEIDASSNAPRSANTPSIIEFKLLNSIYLILEIPFDLSQASS
jgi:hypothetical protein